MIGEWVRIFAPVGDAYRRKGLTAFPITITVVTLIIVMAVAYHNAHMHVFIRHHFDEYGDLSIRSTLLRMIPSIFPPASRLPIYGAVIQVLVVFAVAEAHFGSRITAIVGLSAHCAATLSSHFFISLGPRYLFGLVHVVGRMADAGPSAVTVGLIVYVCVRNRMIQGPLLLIAFLITEWLLQVGLASREHLVAGLVGLVFGVVAGPRVATPKRAVDVNYDQASVA